MAYVFFSASIILPTTSLHHLSDRGMIAYCTLFSHQTQKIVIAGLATDLFSDTVPCSLA